EVGPREEVADHRDVGEITADEDQAIIGTEELGKSPLELAVQGELAGDDAARRGRGAVLVDRRLGSLGYRGMAGQAEIIVAGEVDQLAAVPADGAAADPVARLEEGQQHAAQIGRADV